jgi:hypothetical protein
MAALPEVSLSGVRPTRDVERALADLRREGVGVVEGALDPALLADVRTALYRAADSDQRRGWRREYMFGADDHINQRVWNLPSRDPVFCDLAEHPMALRFIKAVVGWPALLSGMSANITALGGESGMLHADQAYMPKPWAQAHGVNIAWCIDDFTVENGATSYVAGSHLSDEEPKVTPADLTPLEAPAGSMIAIEGRLWHTNGVNTNGVRRAGIFGWYTLPIYLPQENWFLSLNPAIRQFGSENLQTLFGFRPQILGRVNGLERL